MVEPLELRATLLMMEGLSNGGLVWRLGGNIDLRVGPTVRETGLHEACRSLLLASPFFFLEEPQAVWTLMSKKETARSTERNRLISRGMQSVMRFVLKSQGVALVENATRIAARMGLIDRLVQGVAHSGHPALVWGLRHRETSTIAVEYSEGNGGSSCGKGPMRSISQLPSALSIVPHRRPKQLGSCYAPSASGDPPFRLKSFSQTTFADSEPRYTHFGEICRLATMKMSTIVRKVLNRCGIDVVRHHGRNPFDDMRFFTSSMEPMLFDVGGNVGQTIDRFRRASQRDAYTVSNRVLPRLSNCKCATMVHRE